MIYSRSVNFAKRNIRRTPFQALTASMVMFLTFLALFIFLILATGSQVILKYYESKPQVIAFFKDGATSEDVDAISNALNLDEKVKETKFVSKEQALEIYRERNKNDPTLLELVTANILPSSLEVSTKAPEDLSYVASILKQEPVVAEVIVPEDVVASLTAATRVIRWVGITVVSFLIIFSIIVTLMIIGFKIRLKRDEIEIMKLVGASHQFIRAPFIIEGTFYGIIGAFTSWVTVYVLIWYFNPFLQDYLGEIILLPVNPLFMFGLLGSGLITAIIIGALGSLAAVRRYLRI